MSKQEMNRLQRGIYQDDGTYQPSNKEISINYSQYLNFLCATFDRIYLKYIFLKKFILNFHRDFAQYASLCLMLKTYCFKTLVTFFFII